MAHPQAHTKKRMHQFMFFLPTMRIPNSIVVCSCMYAFLWSIVPRPLRMTRMKTLKNSISTPPYAHGPPTGSHQKKDAPVYVLPAHNCVYPILLLSAHAHAFLWEWDSMRTPRCDGIHIGSIFHKNAYMHEQTTIGIHKVEVPKLVYTLSFWCKPVHLKSWICTCRHH